MNIKFLLISLCLICPLSLNAGEGDDSSSSDSEQSAESFLSNADRLEAQQALGEGDDDEPEPCSSIVRRHKKSIAATFAVLICAAGGATAYAVKHASDGWNAVDESNPCTEICRQFAESTGQEPTDYYASVILDDVETYTLEHCPQAAASSRKRDVRGGGRGGHSRKRRGGYAGPRLHKGLPVCTTVFGYTPDLPAATLPAVNETDADLPDLIYDKD